MAAARLTSGVAAASTGTASHGAAAGAAGEWAGLLVLLGWSAAWTMVVGGGYWRLRLRRP
jgi:hypothetical protein